MEKLPKIFFGFLLATIIFTSNSFAVTDSLDVSKSDSVISDSVAVFRSNNQLVSKPVFLSDNKDSISVAIDNKDSVSVAIDSVLTDSINIADKEFRRKSIDLTDTVGGAKPFDPYACAARAKLEDTTMYFTWRRGGFIGEPYRTVVENSLSNVYIANKPERTTASYVDMGSLGSPGISLVYPDRKKKSDFMFFRPYEATFICQDDIDYFNTRKPYSEFHYIGAGPSKRSDQCVGGLFTINAGPRLNFGMYGEWTNSYGAYEATSTRNANCGFFSSYMGRRSSMMSSISFAKFENYENGGFKNESYITNPEDWGNPADENIPVYMSDNVYNRLHSFNMALNYKFHIGFDREYKVSKDSVIVSYVPVTSIVLDAKYESDWKRYNEKRISAEQDSFYHISETHTRNFNNKETIDSVLFRQFRIKAGLQLNEEFNRLMKFGLTAYYCMDMKTYHYRSGRGSLYSEWDEAMQRQNKIQDGVDSLGNIARPYWGKTRPLKTGIGVILNKRNGSHFFYDFAAEYFFLDEKKTGKSFHAEGNIKAVIGRKGLLEVFANASFESKCPDFFEEFYYSNYLVWNKNFDNKRELHIGGGLKIDKIGLSARVGYYNLGNYIYFNENAKPAQSSSPVNVLYVEANEKLKFSWFHWDNIVCFQKTSHESILPIPTLALTSDIYVRTPAFFKKSLTLQLGARLNFFTKYYAEKYMPATGMYYAQSERQYGGYPFFSLYGEMQLKVVQFYLIWNHLNQKMGDNMNYLVRPGYAMSPSFLRVGIAVVFDD